MEQMDKLVEKRNYGIDALRLLSMFFVTILHVLGKGGVLSAAQGGQFAVSWLIEIGVYCAVDCYAVISGYVSYSDEEKPYRNSKYISVWLQVVFYSFGITLLTFFLKPDAVGIKELAKSLFPVTTCQYWYFNAYTGVFFAAPWLNRFIRERSKKDMKLLLILIISVFSVYSTLASPVGDPFILNGGYSFVWLFLLYIIGACMKKLAVPEKMKTGCAVWLGAACVFITWCIRIFMPFGESFLISYTSPTILCVACMYVIVFSKLRIAAAGRKIISCFVPAAFGVYLFHVQSIIWENVIKMRFVWIADSPVWLVPLEVIMCSGGIFIAGLLVEKVRIWVFGILGIDSLVQKIVLRIKTQCKSVFQTLTDHDS